MYKVVRTVDGSFIQPQVAARYRWCFRAVLFWLGVECLNRRRLPHWLVKRVRYRIEWEEERD